MSGKYTERYNAARSAVIRILTLTATPYTEAEWDEAMAQVVTHFKGHRPITIEIELEGGGMVRCTFEHIPSKDE
jgi:hypothetical protein